MIRKILNTIASDGGDITLDKQLLTIATLPGIEFDNINRATVLLNSLAEIRQVKRVTFTAANNTTYKFTIEQIVDGVLVSKPVQYTSDASGDNAEIREALRDSFNNAKSGIKAVATSTSNTVDFTADAKYDTDNVLVV